MARDPEVARAVERHRAMAAQVRGAYEGVLEEPVPERLAALVAESGRRRRSSTSPRDATPGASRSGHCDCRPGPRWPHRFAVGLFVGMFLMREPAAPYEASTARSWRAASSTRRWIRSSLPLPTELRRAIGISFRNRDGDYCRTFHLQRDASVAGLACRSGDAWQLQVLAAAPPHEGELRPAAAMPIPVLQAVDAAIDGEPLDAAAEAAARDAGWR